MNEDRLLNANGVSELLGISTRGVWRFRDMGKLPPPVTLGRLVRWRQADLTAWIADGCPDCRKTGWTAPTRNEARQCKEGGAR